DAALESFESALAILRALDLKPALAEFTLKEAEVRLLLGQLEEVRPRLDAARGWLKETENREQSADLAVLEGSWLSARGEAEPSRRSFERGMALAKESGSRAAMLHSRIAAASAGVDRGEAAAAGELSRALS